MVVLVCMGVCGSGKTTVGMELAKHFAVDFCDADTHHSQHNIDKMKSGKQLSDEDRLPWLKALNVVLGQWAERQEHSCVVKGVLACSALKHCYREILSEGVQDKTLFLYLKGDRSVLAERMRRRAEHYMPLSLLDSQLSLLEEPHCKEFGVVIYDSLTVLVNNDLDKVFSEAKLSVEKYLCTIQL